MSPWGPGCPGLCGEGGDSWPVAVATLVSGLVMVMERVRASQGLFYVGGTRMRKTCAYPEENVKDTKQRTGRKGAA